MLFHGSISLQPKKEVLVGRVAPTKIFGKLFHAITSGELSLKEKQQTFCAISVLQELNIAMRRAGISNIIRLAKDGEDFYFDTEGTEDDLSDTMQDFDANAVQMSQELFKHIYLLLEYQDELMRYLIEIDIKREHAVDEMPINITINGVIKAFEQHENENEKQLHGRIKGVLKKQKKYSRYSAKFRKSFDKFVTALYNELTAAIDCQDSKKSIKVQLLQSQEKGTDKLKAAAQKAPVFRGYPGWESATSYALLWIPVLIELKMKIKKVEVINKLGEPLQDMRNRDFDNLVESIFELYENSGTSSWLDSSSSDTSSGSSSGSSCGGSCSS